MISPEKTDVLILCGGKGTRFRTVRNDIPKILAPIKGKAYIDILLDQLAQQNLRRIILATGYLGYQIEKYVQERTDLVIQISQEVQPLGTGGAIKNAEGLLKSDPILVMNGDTMVKFNFKSMLGKYKKNDSDAILLASKSNSKSQYGSIHTNESGQLINFVEKQNSLGGGLINAGVYLLSRLLIMEIEEKKPTSIEYDLLPYWLSQKRKINTLIIKDQILDYGTPENYNIIINQKSSM